MAIPLVGSRRQSLFEQINRLEFEADDEELFQLIEEISEEVEADKFYRYAATKTQQSQDQVLRDYIQFCCLFSFLPKQDTPEYEAMTDDERHLKAFLIRDRGASPDFSDLFARLRKFLVFVARFARGREFGDKVISYKGLIKYRQNILFWVNRLHTIIHQPALPPPNNNTIYNSLVLQMIAIAKRYNLKPSSTFVKSEVGLGELRQLIDNDMMTTANIEIAEAHHLAWVISRVCAVCPGSLGAPDGTYDAEKLPFLTWRDVDIQSENEPGRFTAKLTFRNLKTNFEDAERHDLITNPKVLHCVVTSPTDPANLIFSIPHRLLIIAIRRKIVIGINSIEELLHTDKKMIMFRNDVLDKPILPAATARGLNVSLDEPLRSLNLSRYLGLRGERLGYAHRITFYSIRRRSATDLTKLLGANEARRILNHGSDSRTLEIYYLNLSPTADLTASAIDGVTQGSSRLDNENFPLAIHALNDKALQMIHGPALNAMIGRMILADPSFPLAGSTREQANWKRRARRIAFRTLLAGNVQTQRQEMTTLQYDERVARLKQSEFAKLIVAKAVENMKAAHHQQVDDDPDVSGEAVDSHGDFRIGAAQTIENEEDLEDLAAIQADENGVVPPIERSIDEINNNEETFEDADVEVPYIEAAKIFMDIVMNNTMTKARNLSSNPVHCPLCEEDDTMPLKDKEKLWSIQVNLNDHMWSEAHTKQVQWQRRYLLEHDVSGHGDEFPCLYCAAIGVPRFYTQLTDLMKHIRSSTGPFEHDRMKREDGWYDADFKKQNQPGKLAREEMNRERNIRIGAAGFGIKYSSQKPLAVGIPHPEIPGIVMGGPPIPLNTANIRRVNTFEAEEIPECLRGIITYGDPINEPHQIPEDQKPYISKRQRQI